MRLIETYNQTLEGLCSVLGITDKDDIITKALERINQSYYLSHEFLEEERHLDSEDCEGLSDYVDNPEMFDHEALDRTFIVSNMVSEYLLDHPTILSNPKLYRLAAIAQSALSSLYREIGTLHLSDEELREEPF